MRGQYGHNTDIWFNTNIFDPDPNVRDGGWLVQDQDTFWAMDREAL
jgi:hypothetical protein